MKNYRMKIQYDGTRYRGWQRQTGREDTIQGKLEAVLSRLNNATTAIDGAGRTDAGVHAGCQVANVHLEKAWSPEELRDKLNEYLPEDIRILEVAEAGGRFHSRLNAKGKTYCYRVLNSDVPHIFDRRYVYRLPDALDMDAMRRAAEALCGTHDYRAFTSNKKSRKSTVRTVDAIGMERIGDEIRFTFSGNGFLYHMVRIMTGTLLEVGMHKRDAGQMEWLLDRGTREDAGFLVPAQGLTLVEVRYK